MAKLGVSELRNPWTDCRKIFDIGDYVSDMTPQAKIQSDRPNGASWQMGEILLSRGF